MLPDSDLLMADPSFLLSEDGIMWLEDDDAARGGIVVPATLKLALRGVPQGPAPLQRIIAPEDREFYDERSGRLAELLGDVEAFRWDSVALDGPAAEVLGSLLESDSLEARLHAEEWAFLESNSWAVSKLRNPLDAFRDAGAVIVEYGRKLRDEMITAVIPERDRPKVLTGALLSKAAAKWIIVGGAGVGGTALGAAGGLLGVAAFPVVRAFDP
jgi:hypothetical protein